MTTHEHAPEQGVDLDAAVRELAHPILLIKAYMPGADRPADLSALPWPDIDQREQVFAPQRW